MAFMSARFNGRALVTLSAGEVRAIRAALDLCIGDRGPKALHKFNGHAGLAAAEAARAKLEKAAAEPVTEARLHGILKCAHLAKPELRPAVESFARDLLERR